MPSTLVACRLFIILAREAPVGVIFRRGPSRWTQIIKWNTDSDTFEYGAWFHGKIYPERCDLSPDGTKLIYFAMNQSHTNGNCEFPATWTAISKIPWLTALCVWPNGDTYYGGGLFETNTKIWINQWNGWGPGYVLSPSTTPQELEISYEHPYWDHDWHNLFRLERSGWKPIQSYPAGSVPVYRRHSDGLVTIEPTDPDCQLLPYICAVHKKSNATGSHSLIMTFTNFYPGGQTGKNSLTFDLKDNQQQTTTPLVGAVWADWDKSGRLVYAQEGKLFMAQSLYSDTLQPEELADFNGLKPKRTKSPAWAREW